MASSLFFLVSFLWAYLDSAVFIFITYYVFFIKISHRDFGYDYPRRPRYPAMLGSYWHAVFTSRRNLVLFIFDFNNSVTAYNMPKFRAVSMALPAGFCPRLHGVNFYC